MEAHSCDPCIQVDEARNEFKANMVYSVPGLDGLHCKGLSQGEPETTKTEVHLFMPVFRRKPLSGSDCYEVCRLKCVRQLGGSFECRKQSLCGGGVQKGKGDSLLPVGIQFNCFKSASS